MILVDKEIKRRAADIFEDGCYDESNVTAISYDLHVQGIIDDEELKESYVLRPNEVVFIKTVEKIHMPDDLMGRIGEKNSRMRQGLCVAGPHYYPGHTTYMYLRVQNITAGTIRIKKNDKIAQIFFEELSDVPEKTYEQQSDASFNDEDQYRGLAKYKDEYEERMDALKDTHKDLDERINHLYANILTIMGVFVSVFSLIMVNFTNMNEANFSKDYIVPMNLSLGIVISLFLGLILVFINKEFNKKFLLAYLALMLVLIVALMIVF